jgi:hypothetical protein
MPPSAIGVHQTSRAEATMPRFAVLSGPTIFMLLVASPIYAAPVDFFATLSGGAENPPNISPGTGSAAVTFDVVAHTLHVHAVFSGLTGTTTASHIHCCAVPPTNAGVATAVPSFPGFPSGVTSGTYDSTFDTTLAASFNPAFVSANGTVAGAEAALFAGMLVGQSYLNIHTTTFPGGEIRGILVTPEAGTLLLLSAGLAGLGQRLWRKRAVR